MNNQLSTQKINYEWIPEVAKEQFETQMDVWYMDLAQRTGNQMIPLITEEMFFNEPTRSIMLKMYKDVFEYRYLSGKLPNFDPNQFPVNLFQNHREDSRLWERSRIYFEKGQSVLEVFFFDDMKRYLMTNKMFFQESYSFTQGPKFRNVPFGEVW